MTPAYGLTRTHVLKQVNTWGRAQVVVLLVSASTWVACAIGFSLPIFVGRSAERVVVGCADEVDNCTVGHVLGADAGCAQGKGMQWTYAHGGRSVASEWDLICHRALMLPMVETAFFLGGLCGNVFLSCLIDSHGRVPCACVFSCLGTVCSVLCALSSSFRVYLVGRFGLGVAQAVSGSAAWLLCCEVTDANHASTVMIAMNSAWAFGLAAFVPAALWLPQWRPLTLVQAVVFVIVSCAWLVAWTQGLDSPAWLADKGDVEGLDRGIKAIARVNRTQYVERDKDSEAPKLVKKLPEKCQAACSHEEASGSFHTMLCSCPDARYIWAFGLVFCSCSLAYCGLEMDSGNIGKDLYVSAVLTALAELPAVWAAKPLMDSVLLGRRGSLFWSIFLTGLFCLAAATQRADDYAIVVVSTLGKLCVSIAYCIVYVHVCEVFPPQRRGALQGIFETAASSTALLVPMLVSFRHPWPSAFIGAFLVLAAFPIVALPETREFSTDPLEVGAEQTVIGNPTSHTRIPSGP